MATGAAKWFNATKGYAKVRRDGQAERGEPLSREGRRLRRWYRPGDEDTYSLNARVQRKYQRG
jgi:hypothetical protein